MIYSLLFLIPYVTFAQVKTESFIIDIYDRSIKVVSPEKSRQLFSIIVENKSLSDQIGRFVINGKIIKYVSVQAGKADTVEIENKSAGNVTFVPVSPAFQDVELKFGKKAYEIPPKE